MDGSLRLFDHQLVGASNHDADCLPWTGAACDLCKNAQQQVQFGSHMCEGSTTFKFQHQSHPTFTSLPEPSRLTSSASSAVPSISGVKWSIWAIGLVPMV